MKSRPTKEAIIQSLKGLAKSLGKDTLTTAEIQQVVPTSSLRSRFGSVGAALEAAELRRGKRGENLSRFRHELTEDELFMSIYEVELTLKREPTGDEYSAFGKFSCKPLTRRFGKWSDGLAHYRRWKSQHRNLESPIAS